MEIITRMVPEYSSGVAWLKMLFTCEIPLLAEKMFLKHYRCNILV